MQILQISAINVSILPLPSSFYHPLPNRGSPSFPKFLANISGASRSPGRNGLKGKVLGFSIFRPHVVDVLVAVVGAEDEGEHYEFIIC